MNPHITEEISRRRERHDPKDDACHNVFAVGSTRWPETKVLDRLERRTIPESAYSATREDRGGVDAGGRNLRCRQRSGRISRE